MTGNAICPTRWPRFASAPALPRMTMNHLGMTTPMTMKNVDAMTVRPSIWSAKWCHSSCTAPMRTNVSPMSAMATVMMMREPYRSISGPTISEASPPMNEPIDIGSV